MAVIYQRPCVCIFWKWFFFGEKLSESENPPIKFKLLHLSCLHSVCCSCKPAFLRLTCCQSKGRKKERCVQPCRSSITSQLLPQRQKGTHLSAYATWSKPNIFTHALIAPCIQQMPRWCHKAACKGSRQPRAPFIAAAGQQQSARPQGRSAGKRKLGVISLSARWLNIQR